MSNPSKFYRNWIVANALGELIGLGITFSMAYLVFSNLGESNALLPVLASDGLFLLTGVIEGWIVGSAQAWALGRLLPQIPKKAWVRATIYGALSAWFLGIIPSTVLSLANPGPAQAGGAEPPAWLIYLLAAGMGLVLGPILALPQWRVLRHSLPRAGWWVLANALAWMVGMPVIFIGTNVIGPGVPAYRIIGALLAAIFTAGAVVGIVHGSMLLKLVKPIEMVEEFR
jgi:hypothetical protein